MSVVLTIFFFQAEDGIRDLTVTGVQTCALPILNVGQVYKTLGGLERDGLAESEGNGDDGPQKRFRITAGGEAELAAWLRTPPDLSAPPRDELVMKVLVAVRVPGVDVHEVIQAHRLYLVE